MQFYRSVKGCTSFAHSLRSHTHSVMCVFAENAVSGKNGLNSFPRCGAELCEATITEKSIAYGDGKDKRILAKIWKRVV